jgi:hypothetical protein
MIVPVLALIGLTPLLGGCHHHDHDRRYGYWERDERRAYPAGYRYGYYDRDCYRDRWHDHDYWRR